MRIALHAAMTAGARWIGRVQESNRERARIGAAGPECFTMFTRKLMSPGGKSSALTDASRDGWLLRTSGTGRREGEIKSKTDDIVNHDNIT